jgi:hypothetical protein
MIASKASRVRLRDLARQGRSRSSCAACGRYAAASASRGEPVTLESII